MFAASEAVANPWIYNNVWLIPALPAASFLLILFFGKRLPFKGAEIGITAVGAAFVLALLTTFTWIGDIQGGGEGGEEHALIADNGTSTEADSVVLTAEDDGHGGEVRGAPVVNEVEWFGIGSDANQVTLGADGEVEGGAEGTSVDSESPFSISIGTLVDGQSVMLLFVVTLVSLLVHIYSTDYVHGDRRYTHYFAFLSLFTAAMLFMVLSSSTIQLIVGWELVGVCSFALIGHWWEEKPNSDAALKALSLIHI